MWEKTILSFENVTGKKPGLSLKNLSCKQFFLNNISFEIKAGYIYGLVGANGAGKTTLMNYILRDNIKYEGQICFEGMDIRKEHAKLLNKIGFVSEDNPFFGECTCRQNADILGIFYEEFDRKKFLDVMESMKLSPNKIYGKMSRGEQLKFQMAFAMAHNPSLYLLDEVTAGMDSVFRVDFFHMLQQCILNERAAVLMTSHISSEIEKKTDYVGVMENGSLIAFGESLDIMPQLKKEGTREGKITVNINS